MLKILPLILATAAISIANANASEMISAIKIEPVNPPEAVQNQEKSFNVFFDSNQASLTPEGREIVSEAAKRFIDSQGPNDRVFVISNGSTDEELPTKRADVVKSELERDGIKPNFIGDVQHLRAVPVSLREWQNRRILIAIRASSAFASAAN